jgi:ubiquitin-conjugating enzyme E2 O
MLDSNTRLTKADEAGFEVLVGSEESRMSSIRYSETAYVLSRGFVKHALRNPVKGFEKEIQSIYFKQYERESLIQTIIIESKAIISQSLGSQSKHASSEDSSIDLGNVTVGGGLITISMGACGLLKRNLTALEDLLSKQL